ncbi:phage tail sheath family protein [Nonomuraea sp. NPDC047897]|uniref:phage tail sheath family protein n=1 Tax=Nonomuraea sp. NPDC047897 TaxID=3364346 RepID=UPI003714718A
MPEYRSPGVYVEEVEAGARPIEGVGTSVAAFVGFTGKGPFNSPTMVTSWSQFAKEFGDFSPGCVLPHAVYGYFLNGGGTCYIVRIGANGSAGPAPGPQAKLGAFRVLPKELPAEDGLAPELTVELSKAEPQEGEQPAPDDRFTLTVKRDGKVEERFENVTTKRGKGNVLTVVSNQSSLITLQLVADEVTVTTPQSVTLKPAPATALVPAPAQVATEDYVGDVAERTGFGGLEAVDQVTMVAVPDLMGAFQRGAIDAKGVKVVQQAIIDHCERMRDRMAILDTPPGMSVQQVRQWREDSDYSSMYATLYYPWIEVFDPAANTARLIPPSGHLAGVWARNDSTRGVHKAPANEVVRGAVSLETQITKNEQADLNPVGVNCVRVFPGRGVRVWGARTLSGDSNWRYLNVRRLFNYLEESILDGTQWVVFEPNDDALWARIRRTIAAFLVMEWRKGALFGLTPDEAFYVKCDRETNPAESIDQGMVVCEIGVAPVKPAEFVIFRLAQVSGGISLVTE